MLKIYNINYLLPYLKLAITKPITKNPSRLSKFYAK